jgi:hypothetical protein
LPTQASILSRPRGGADGQPTATQRESEKSAGKYRGNVGGEDCSALQDIREHYASIAFGDDKAFFQLQAADMISSLVRQEMERRVYGRPFDMRRLYEVTCEDIDSSFCTVVSTPMDADFLSGLAKAERLSRSKRR